MDMVEFSIEFTGNDCDVCDEVHAVAAPAPCSRPPKPDPCVEHRRQELRGVTVDLTDGGQESPLPGSPDPEDWFDQLLALSDALLEGFRAVAEDGVGLAVHDAVADLRMMRARAAATSRYRPHLAGWKVVDGSLDRLAAVARLYLDALTVPDMDTAQQRGVEAQRCLYEATGMVADYRARQDRAKTVERQSDADHRIGVLLGTADAAHTTVDEERLDSDLLYERVVGERPCPTDLAPGLRMTAIQAEILFDERRFWAVSAEVFGFVTASPERVDYLVGCDAWRKDFAKAEQAIFDAGVDGRLKTQNWKRESGAARNLMSMAHAFIEGAAKYLLAGMLAAERKKGYERLRRNIGTVVDQVSKAGLDNLLVGLDKTLRHAAAHHDYEARPDGIRFTDPGADYPFLTWDEAFDRVIAAYESTIAVHNGITLALASHGVIEDPIQSLDLDPEERIKLTLAFLGVQDVTPRLGNREAHVSFHGDMPATQVGSALSPCLPDDIDKCAVAVASDDGEDVVECDPRLFRAWRCETDSVKQNIRFVESLAGCTKNGQPVVSRDQFRQYAARSIRGLHPADPPSADTVRTCRAIRDAAERLHDTELKQAIDALTPQFRAQLLGQHYHGDIDAANGARLRLIHWYMADLPPIAA